MMKSRILIFCVFMLRFYMPAGGQNVRLVCDTTGLQAAYAAGTLRKALRAAGYTLREGPADYEITLSADPDRLEGEAFTIVPGETGMSVTGGDGRGLIYGALSLADDLQNGTLLRDIAGKSGQTHLHFRAVKFDLPWDTYRHSYSLSQHQETCRDTAYWEAFLDMMARNRLNTLTLWNLHPYPFLIRPQNFPEACPWTDAEMQAWKALFRSIFRMARARGIDTYIMPFNIFVTPEFARAHQVALNNLEHHHFVQADTSAVIRQYTRECVTQMLNEYPDLSGIGLTLGEGMGGMTPLERENWIRETIIEGMRLANRKSKLIHRIPFSGTTGSLGATSVDMERITRQGIEQEAAMECFEGPVWASLKFNWSHGHSTPRLIKVHGGKIYGTYWNPEPEGYRMVWTVRNEDFFCLRWGAINFVRSHIRTNTKPYVGGYFIGSETYIPAKDYFTRPEIDVEWKYAFERQWLFYMLWGRLLYDPSTPDELFMAEFVRRYGKEAGVLLEAYDLAGRTPLRLASSFDCTWDFTLYSEGFLALNPATRRVDYISVDRQIHRPPLDTALVSVAEYVRGLLSGESLWHGRVTPSALADSLETDCRQALDLVKGIDTSGNNALMFEVADVKAWAGLGLYFAEKLRGAVALETYRLKGDEENKKKAVRHLEKALGFWDDVIRITRPLYNDMPLVHYSEQDGRPWEENDHLRFHWALLRPDVARDVEIAKNAVPYTAESGDNP